MPTQAERRTATRARILDAARRAFVAQGWEATTIQGILADAGVSRGALYHHFESKEAIAEALFDHTSTHAITEAARTTDDPDPLTHLTNACLAWLSIVRRPDVAAIMFEVGPTALGWARCREIEDRNSLRVMRLSIRRAADAGQVQVASVEMAARFLNAVLTEATLALVHPTPDGPDEATVVASVRQTIGRLAPTV